MLIDNVMLIMLYYVNRYFIFKYKNDDNSDMYSCIKITDYTKKYTEIVRI